GGRLHRGSHGAAGEIAYLPIANGEADAAEAKRRGTFEASASASAIVKAAKHAGIKGSGLSARRVFQAALDGDERASQIVAGEALLVAKALGSVIAVVDPDMIVLGGGIGRAPGFSSLVADALAGMAPFVPEIRVSALGDDAVVEGCLAAALERAWRKVLERG